MNCPCSTSMFLSTSLKYKCPCLFNSIKDKINYIKILSSNYNNNSLYLRNKLRFDIITPYKNNLIQKCIMSYDLLAISCRNIISFTDTIQGNFIQCSNANQINRRQDSFYIWMTKYNTYSIECDKVLLQLKVYEKELNGIDSSYIPYNLR